MDEIITFLREELGEHRLHIGPDNLLDNDLGVTGDEAIELIKSFSNSFNVDISQFEFSKYFYPEPSMFSNFEFNILPLSVADLVKARTTGKLE